jgi:WxL domain surface cell wall-binding
MRNSKNHLNASARRLRIGLAVAASALAVCVLPATALGATVNDTTQFSVSAGTLGFSTNPDIQSLTGVTLSGQAQSTASNMANFGVSDATGSGSGYNVTVVGDSSGGHSAVFKQYCPNATCGTDTGPGYIASSPATLAANSLTLNSTGASFSAQNGTTGTAPTHSCNSGCFVDTASPVKVVSAAAGAGMGTYLTNYAASSLSLATPSNTKILQTNEVYRIDLVWSLNSGP